MFFFFFHLGANTQKYYQDVHDHFPLNNLSNLSSELTVISFLSLGTSYCQVIVCPSTATASVTTEE